MEPNKYFMNCYRYIYQNPIRAGLSITCEGYPFSTLNYIVKSKPFSIPIHDKYGFKDRFGLHWLNSSIHPREIEALKYAFKKPVIKTLKDRRTRKELSDLKINAL